MGNNSAMPATFFKCLKKLENSEKSNPDIGTKTELIDIARPSSP
jgi:hypothetical protein